MKLAGAFIGVDLSLVFLVWYALSDVALILMLDRGLEADWMAFPWIVLHFAVNSVLACIVTVATVTHAVRSCQPRQLAGAFLLAPVLLTIPYLGFTRDFRLLALLGLKMRGIQLNRCPLTLQLPGAAPAGERQVVSSQDGRYGGAPMYRSPSDVRRGLLRAVLLMTTTVACVSTSSAGDLYPLTDGVQWIYQEIYPASVETLSTYFVGTADFNGVLTHVQRHTHSPWFELGEDYWSQDLEGRVYNHGWKDGPQTCTFDPPVLWIDTPLLVGKKWSISTMTSLFGLVTADFEVTAIGPVSVPAGTFTCTTIKRTDTTPATASKGGRSLLRPPVAAVGPSYTSYADGVGEVRSDLGVPGRFDQLVYFGPRVGVAATTWSAVRQLYR